MYGFGMGALTSVQTGQVRTMAQQVLLEMYNLVPSDSMRAQRITLPASVASWLAVQYANQVQRSANSVPTKEEIRGDNRLHQIVKYTAPASSLKGGGGGGILATGGNWGLTGQLIRGVPNYLLYGGAAVLGLLAFKKFGHRKK
jgi:hypothetical protein